MSNKIALRELQSRLADRLQAAKSEGTAVAWLAVRVGQDNYLLPLAQAGEIFQMTSPAPMPYAKPWLIGVVNLRGGLYSVVDFAAFVKNERPAARTEQAWTLARLVNFNPELEINCALVVDALIGLRRQDAFSSVSKPAEGSPEYYGQLLTDANGVCWQELNLQTLARNDEFLNVGQ